jgi:hypothetical protein
MSLTRAIWTIITAIWLVGSLITLSADGDANAPRVAGFCLFLALVWALGLAVITAIGIALGPREKR